MPISRSCQAAWRAIGIASLPLAEEAQAGGAAPRQIGIEALALIRELMNLRRSMMAVIIHLNRVSFLAAREEKQILRFAQDDMSF
jgi:hypothetical protein